MVRSPNSSTNIYIKVKAIEAFLTRSERVKKSAKSARNYVEVTLRVCNRIQRLYFLLAFFHIYIVFVKPTDITLKSAIRQFIWICMACILFANPDSL